MVWGDFDPWHFGCKEVVFLNPDEMLRLALQQE